MASWVKTILIIGATSGIGEAFARRFHSMGKKVIITGRRQDRLSQLQGELPGIETRTMDNTDIANLLAKVSEILSSFPDINTVWINSGIQRAYQYSDLSTFSNDMITEEITTNVTAPMILARLLIPHLLSLRPEANLMITSSALAFVPMGVYPVYCPTKAAIHSFMVCLRQQLQSTSVNVIEIAPPYVATELDVNHRGSTEAQAMPLQEYTDQIFEILDANKPEALKEVAVGFAAVGAEAWRNSIGNILAEMKLGG